MERIAFIIGHTYLYWSSIILLLAGMAAVCLFLSLYLRKKKRILSGLIAVILAAIMSFVLSRLAYWYFRPDSYESMEAALDWIQPGGAALMGVFAGCFLAAVSLWLFQLEKDLPDLLDCMSIALCFGIGLGQLSSFFNNAGRGMTVGIGWGLPWAVSTLNPVSGAMEHRFASFLIQAMAAGVLFLVLLVFYLVGKGKRGDTTLLFLLVYGASQVVLDSTRYDSLYLRSNGFVSAVQVLGAAGILLAALVFAVRLVRAGGWKKWHALLWLGQAACLGLAGYMEYHVQRHGNQALFAYSTMSGALAGVIILILATRHLAGVEHRRHQAWLAQLAATEQEDP